MHMLIAMNEEVIASRPFRAGAELIAMFEFMKDMPLGQHFTPASRHFRYRRRALPHTAPAPFSPQDAFPESGRDIYRPAERGA